MSAELLIHTVEIKKVALLFRTINNKKNLKILFLLHKNGGLPASTINKKMKLAEAACSRRLGILRRVALVLTEREGKQVFYSVNYQRVKLLHDCATVLLSKG